MTPQGTTTSMTKGSSDLLRRFATICIGFPLVWGMLSQPFLARIFFMGAHGLSLWEYTLLEPRQLSNTSATQADNKPGVVSRILYVAISVLLAAGTAENDNLFHLALCYMTGVLVCLDRRHWVLGLLLVTLPFRAWIGLAPRDFASTISVLLVVWNCDTGALLAGRMCNRFNIRRIPVPNWIRKISPAKSMEGFVGGILGGTWTAVSWIPFLVHWTSLDTTAVFGSLWESRLNRLGLGVALSVLAIVGDLFESAIKRQSQSKDSGSFLPGHGGILDRFDSSLLAILLYKVLLKD